MLYETINKLKGFTVKGIRKFKPLKFRRNTAEISKEEHDTLKMTVGLPAQSNMNLRMNTRALSTKNLFFYPKSSVFYKYATRIPWIASRNRFVRGKMLGYAALFGMTAFLVNEFFPTRTKIALSYKANPENAALASKLTYLHNQHFYPTFYIFGALFQSVTNLKIIANPVNYQREYLKLQDGGTIALDWANPCVKENKGVSGSKYTEITPDEKAPTIFVIHGLTGGSDAGYIRSLVKRAQKKGFRVVVFNHRGVNQPLSTPFPSHGGKLDDIVAAIDHVRAKLPNAKLLAVGNSLGGNQLLRYLALTGENCPFDSAVALSSPFDLNKTLEVLQGSVYEKFFIKKYAKNTILPHLDILAELTKSHDINLDQVLTTTSLRGFHESFTVKAFKCKDSYELLDTLLITKDLIQNIKIPTLILHAKDDPIVTSRLLPKEDIVRNDKLILAETSRGGHICWFSGMKPKRWYPKPVVEFLEVASDKKA